MYNKKKPVDKKVQISKTLAYLLRHGAEKEKLAIGSDGYVKLDDIMKRHEFKYVTVEQIMEIVNNNDKKRFEVCTKPDENGLNCKFIRAVQGHSISKIQDEELLEPLKPEDLKQYPVIVHGTFK